METVSWENIGKMDGILKLDGCGFAFLYSKTDHTIIEVFWDHTHGFKQNGSYVLDDRLIIRTGRYEDYKEFLEATNTKTFDIKKYQYLAVNWFEKNFRILYRLNYNPDTKHCSKEVVKLPMQGQRLMTFEEKQPSLTEK